MTLAYTIDRWSEFATAHVGASAALLGLVFVGLTINLRDVVTSRLLVNRAAEAVILLGSVLAISTAVLIPGQKRDALSTELIVLAIALFAVISLLQRGVTVSQVASNDTRAGPPRASIVIRRVFGFGSPALIGITGITLAATTGGGLYWLPAAIIAAYMGAIANAWVLLIEILR
jgi:modulator of FtsH protease